MMNQFFRSNPNGTGTVWALKDKEYYLKKKIFSGF